MGSLFSSLSEADETTGSEYGLDIPKGPHIPTEDEVYIVQTILLDFLPLELVNIIIDKAQYWPRLICRTESDPPQRISALNDAHYTANVCCYISPRIPAVCQSGKSRMKVRKLVFRIRSRDQGWGGDPGLVGPYEGSYTWFEAAIFRNLEGDHDARNPEETARLLQGRLATEGQEGAFQVPNPDNGSKVWHLQTNIRASNEEAMHEIAWTYDDSEAGLDVSTTGTGSGYGFVRELRAGDSIAIYARAQFPGWTNHVRGIEIQIFYSV